MKSTSRTIIAVADRTTSMAARTSAMIITVFCGIKKLSACGVIEDRVPFPRHLLRKFSISASCLCNINSVTPCMVAWNFARDSAEVAVFDTEM